MSAVSIAVALAKEYEGFHAAPYHDPVGFPTRGYGELLSREKWAPLSGWERVTREEAEKWLEGKMEEKQADIARLFQVPLVDTQRAALMDFAYNVGTGALKASSLRARINRRDAMAHMEFRKWTRAGGIVLPGLIRRRAAEECLFTGS